MDDGCAPSAGFGGGVRPVLDEGRAGEDAADGLALDADAFAVNDADGAKTRLPRLAQVFFDDAPDITRRDGVEVNDVSNLDAEGFGEGIEGVYLRVVREIIRRDIRRSG